MRRTALATATASSMTGPTLQAIAGCLGGREELLVIAQNATINAET
jgi:hypothetical protein